MLAPHHILHATFRKSRLTPCCCRAWPLSQADACLFFLASVLPALGALLLVPSTLSPLRYSSLVAGPALLLLLQHPDM